MTVGVLHGLLPDSFRLLPSWGFELFLLLVLVVLVIGDPGRIDRDTPWLRLVTGVMISAITIANGLAVGRLLRGIVAGAAFTDASELLRTGVIVWLVNVIAFALWYWALDGGGSVARSSGRQRRTRGFAFKETELPEHADDGWFPQFVDYVALSFNTAAAFGPTDVSAVKAWSKLLLIAESMTSLAIALLVLARAINTWPTIP